MQVQQPRVQNSGFFSKTVQVEYQRPRTESTVLGVIPISSLGETSPEVPDGVVSTSKENPTYLPGYKSEPLRLKEVVIDSNGQPEMETVQTELTVAGPKAQALGHLLGSAFMGGICGVAISVPVMGLAMLGGLVRTFGLGGGGDITASTATTFLAWASGVGAGLGALAGISGARERYSATNTLDWQSQPMVSRELTGFEVKNGRTEYGQRRVDFEPVFQETPLGNWNRPVLNNGSPQE